jgi:hypothetical protein
MHSHSFLVSNWRMPKAEHSHTDGNTAHQHDGTGPAAYTIDKDEWLRTTGLRGGSRKKFTAKPKGPQLPRVELLSDLGRSRSVSCSSTRATPPSMSALA